MGIERSLVALEAGDDGAAEWECGRRLVVCNGMAYACAQRRRVLGQAPSPVARSARECFILNSSYNDRVYAEILRGQEIGHAV